MNPQEVNTDDAGSPSFLDLMEIWRTEFNEEHKGKCEMFYHDFTNLYLCMKIKQDGETDILQHTCIGHLYTGKSKEGYGVEFGDEFLRPEDPDFFPRLLKRVKDKIDEYPG